VKESQAQIQSNRELLAELQPAFELKIARKAVLEAKLKNLTAEIEADKKKIAKLPGLTEKIQKEAFESDCIQVYRPTAGKSNIIEGS
jgi:hypothetical protein